MNKFRTGIPLILLLAGIFTGIGASVLHPYVHVLKNHLHPVETHSENGYSNLHSLNSAESCYVCAFSKQLVLDSLDEDAHSTQLLYEFIVQFPTSHRSAGDVVAVFLRGPPLA